MFQLRTSAVSVENHLQGTYDTNPSKCKPV